MNNVATWFQEFTKHHAKREKMWKKCLVILLSNFQAQISTVIHFLSSGALRGTKLEADVPSCVYWSVTEIEQDETSIRITKYKLQKIICTKLLAILFRPQKVVMIQFYEILKRQRRQNIKKNVQFVRYTLYQNCVFADLPMLHAY